MLCSENPSVSKGCCHTMCCRCKAKGLIPPLLAPLCISRKGIEAAESKPPQSRCGEWVSQVDGCIIHSFQLVFPVFLLPSLSRKWNWKTEKKNHQKQKTPFDFFLRTWLWAHFLPAESLFKTPSDSSETAPQTKMDYIRVENKIMLFKEMPRKNYIRKSLPGRITFYCKSF